MLLLSKGSIRSKLKYKTMAWGPLASALPLSTLTVLDWFFLAMSTENIRQYFIFGLFIIATSLLAYMAWSFKHAVVFGVILTALFAPLNEYLIQRFSLSRRKGSLIVCVGIVIIVILPLALLISRLSVETYQLYEKQRYLLNLEYLQQLLSPENQSLVALNETLSIIDVKIDLDGVTTLLLDNAQELSTFAFNTIQSWVTGTFTVTFSFVFQFIIMMGMIYGMFINGAAVKKFLFVMLPLSLEQEEVLLEKLKQMNYVTFICNGVGGVIQGVAAGVGFYFAGIEPVILWGAVMVILAFIPLLGISIVYVPASIYLLTQQSYLAALLLFVYCTAVALIVENVYKPRFIGKRIKVDSMLLLMSIIGGLASFGVFGIFYGPLILTIYLSLFDFITANKVPAQPAPLNPQE